eukprot:6198685-Pleurochrysis_carterae.AAC.2
MPLRSQWQPHAQRAGYGSVPHYQTLAPTRSGPTLLANTRPRPYPAASQQGGVAAASGKMIP